MTNSKILLPVALAGVLLAAMVVAAPRGADASKASGIAPNRAVAFAMAMAD